MSQNLFNFVKPDVGAILNTVAITVGSTLGQNGKSIIVGNGEKTYTTKDGVSVLRFIHSNDPYIQNTINIIRETSENTLREAGDGTTSTVIVANAILQLISGGKVDKNQLKSKIKEMIEKIPTISEELTEKNIKLLIETAVGNEVELVNVLYEAYKKSEEHNVPITLEPTLGKSNRVDIIDGISFKSKIVSDIFNAKEVVMENPHVICYSGNIESEKEVIKAIDKCVSMGIKNVIIIANGYTEEALAIMSINHLQGTINLIPLMISSGDMHETEITNIIASSLDAEIGGESFSTRLYDSFTKPYDKVDNFRFNNNMATFEGIKANNDLSKEIDKYSKDLNNADDDDEMNKLLFIISMYKRKIVKAVISASIENKLNELKDRADDALQNIITAKENGVVKGSGEAYIKLNKITKDSVVFEKCFQAVNNILNKQSGGLDSAKTIEAVLRSSSELALLLNDVSFVINVEIADKK